MSSAFVQRAVCEDVLAGLDWRLAARTSRVFGWNKARVIIAAEAVAGDGLDDAGVDVARSGKVFLKGCVNGGTSPSATCGMKV